MTSRLIAAIDTADLGQAGAWVSAVAPHCGLLKFGLEFYLRHGAAGLRVAAGAPVFLDLKLHDIPNTVAGAVRALGGLDVRMLTVHAGGVTQQVLRLARLALGAGADGVVCSAREVPVLRDAFGPDPVLVVPGIRPAGAATGDQARVMTPVEAITAGASYIVVGRPITTAPDPASAAAAIAAEIVGS
jgi:orotidine-5'-phosphate decarboxylase